MSRSIDGKTEPVQSRIYLSVSILTLACGIVGCGGSNKQVAQEVAKVAQLQAMVSQSLADPLSAQFMSVKLNSRHSSICGQVNARNSLGGYVGYREFFTKDDDVFVKPTGCGEMPIGELSTRSTDDALTCLAYVNERYTNISDICS